ncbi:hypothetical protein [Herbaspirillum sp. B65]|jgi:hypothetical protein|uniref:hypothetical protein n=1 Tax=Herbaspirillum sp. B65 TaxID=137708 RepID=UPI0011D2592D|nr:hypothetical protein [Herbaspirillum sp. B65]
MSNPYNTLRNICLAAVTMLVVTGCLPVKETYFEPSGSGIVARKGFCNGRYGAPQIASLDLDAFRIGVTLSYNGLREMNPAASDSIFLRLSMTIPENMSLTIDPDLIRVKTLDGQALVRLSQPLAILVSSYPAKLQPQKVLRKTTFSSLAKKQDFSLLIEYASRGFSDFSVYPSEIEWNGKKYILPEINFKKKTYFEMLMLNC